MVLEKEEINKWHGKFACECNNVAWTLSEKTSRTESENREMLNAAHAAAFHWAQIKTEIQIMRANILLAHVHALMGFGDSSFRYAKQCLKFVNANEILDWELAFTYAIMAHAGCLVGDNAVHRKFYEHAQKAGDRIADENEKKYFLTTFNQVPKSELT